MKATTVLFLLCLALGPVSSLHAASPDVQPQNLLPPSSRTEAPEPRVSRGLASDIARENFPGRVLSIRRDNENWRVRMDQDGRVSDVLVDAESGQVTRPSEQE
jgi:uncharacterized membrane protein YkoI